MRVVVLAVLIAGVIDAPPSRATEGPWCARFWGGDDYYESCSLRSFEMCLGEIRGTGGNTVCSPNPRYRPAAVAPAAHPRHSRRHPS
ncbi:MAG: hypothetical protein QOG74_1463 [Alphaproteobacteria bacterium]|jgi:hypothetical protein|nr:hypothetical protein [Alphaproteobacteria bacterium]